MINKSLKILQVQPKLYWRTTKPRMNRSTSAMREICRLIYLLSNRFLLVCFVCFLYFFVNNFWHFFTVIKHDHDYVRPFTILRLSVSEKKVKSRLVYKCHTCFKVYSTQRRLNIHDIIAHSYLDYKPYKCDKCAFKTAYISSLKRHNNAKHKFLMNWILGPKSHLLFKMLSYVKQVSTIKVSSFRLSSIFRHFRTKIYNLLINGSLQAVSHKSQDLNSSFMIFLYIFYLKLKFLPTDVTSLKMFCFIIK